MGAERRDGEPSTPIDRVRALYESDHARLWRSIHAFSASREVADEATAEAFAQALRRGDEIRDLKAWVWTSAYAIARGELSRRARSGGDQPRDVAVEADHGLAHLLDALRELSDSDRQLVVLCHVAGWRPGELAALSGESPSALRVRLHRATRRARALLAEAQEAPR